MEKKQEAYDFQVIDIESILPPEEANRMEIPESNLVELSESMKELGLIQPIVLSEKDGKFEIVAGHRRWLAAKRLGWKDIAAIVKALDRTQIALIRAAENLQREGLTYIEEAAIYADLYHEHNLTLQMISDRMGKAIGTVKGRLDLLNMDDEVQKAIHFKKISPYVAVELSKIDDQKALYRYLDLAIENGVTAQQMAQWVDDRRKGLAFNPDRGGGGGQQQEPAREQKSFTMCEFCKGPVEYKDAHNLTACPRCNDLVLMVVAQGHFKEEEKPQ